MKKLGILLACSLVGIVVAINYYLFEYAVRHSIDYIWESVFNTENTRHLVIPVCVGLSFVFFGLQHRFDSDSVNHEAHSLGGEKIKPTINNLLIILSLGYFSLIAGASLGPEAVLVPASVVIGAVIGVKLFKKNKEGVSALTAAAVIALMTAFFHSFVIGVLSLLIITKQSKSKVSPALVIIAVISSGSSLITLNFINPTHRYFNFPELSWKVAIIDILAGILLFIAGFISTYLLKNIHDVLSKIRTEANLKKWWHLAFIASISLGTLYMLGGPLVEFTGNESIAPLISQAPSLGLWGLLWIFIIKLLAICWSRVFGYRGGLIFPMIFVASTLVVITQIVFKDANFGVGLLAAIAGILVADKNTKILL